MNSATLDKIDAPTFYCIVCRAPIKSACRKTCGSKQCKEEYRHRRWVSRTHAEHPYKHHKEV